MNLKSSWDVAGPFAPHGEFTLTSVGEILCYEAAGPFNIETLQALRITRIKAYEKWQDSGTFAVIVHWHHSVLMSLEAFDAYRDGYIKFIESTHARAVIAWVATPDVEGMNFMVQRFADVFEQTNTQFRLFSDLAQGRAWVEENLATLKTQLRN